MFNKILCPTDGSDHAYKALDLAIDMAKKYDAELVILHVPHRSENIDALRRFAEIEGLAPHVNTEIARLRSMDYRISVATDTAFQDLAVSPRLLIEIGRQIVDGAKERAKRSGLENVDALIEVGDPADRILKCIDKEKIDCVIMGSRGLNDLKGLFLGSVSHKVANRAPCTCIAVKQLLDNCYVHSQFSPPQVKYKDVSGDSNCYEINLEVPGLTESDLSLEVKDDVLTIKGKKEERSEDKDKHYYRVERSYGSFQRTLALPDDAIGDDIKANLDKGVLRLEIPRRETATQDVKRISINS